MRGSVGRPRPEQCPHPFRDRFIENMVMERVEKILPVRSAFEEIQDLFLDRIGFVQPGNITTRDHRRRKVVSELHDLKPCHNQF